MKTKEILASSVGQFAQDLLNAYKEGYTLSDKPSNYPWVDTQYHAILVLSEDSTETPSVKPPQRGRPVKS